MQHGVPSANSTIRPATIRDVPAIAALIDQHAQRGRMLFRSHAELYETLRDFVVCVDEAAASAEPRKSPRAEGAIVGVCALEIVWADLAEVKSLAVSAGAQGRGIGRALVAAVEAQARALHIQRIFALTYEADFFSKMGFSAVDRNSLPLKVWSDCVKCPKHDGCDETAVVKILFDKSVVAELPVETGNYNVPSPLVQVTRLGKK